MEKTMEQEMELVLYTYREVRREYMGFPQLGLPSKGPRNKDYSILVSLLGSPYFGKPPYCAPRACW